MLNVSIIIPVYNEAVELEKVLTSLGRQTVNQSEFEVIVVDNASTDNTRELVRRFKEVIYLREDRHLNSPYSCRNRGLEIAKGNIIVLLDGTCIPEPDWLEKGLNFMDAQKADMISSNVIFDFRGKVTAGKLYDSNNLKIERSIQERGAVMTASLFVRREVFEQVGRFPEGVRSGGDLRWTHRATRQGFSLMFCRDSIAKKKARTFLQSVHKQWRVGKAQPAIWEERGIQKNVFKKLIRSLIPSDPRKIKRLFEDKGIEVTPYQKFKLYFVANFIWVVMSAANVYGRYFMKKEEEETSGVHGQSAFISKKRTSRINGVSAKANKQHDSLIEE